MKRRKEITEAELINAVNREGLGIGHPFETELDLGTASKSDIAEQLPGTIGVTRAANDEGYVCYAVNEKRKIVNVTHHETWEEGFAEALDRYRGFAKEPGFVKADGDSFQYGPVSNYRSVEKTLEEDRLQREHDANPPYLESEGSVSKCGPSGHEYEYSIIMEEPKKHSCACMKWLPDEISYFDGELLEIIESSVNESLEGKADVKADWFWKTKQFSYDKKVNCDTLHLNLLSDTKIDFDDLSSCVTDLFQKMDSLAEASSYEPGVEGYINAYKDHQAENDFAAAVNDMSQTDITMDH